MMGSEEAHGRLHSRELERLQNMVRKLGVDKIDNTEEGSILGPSSGLNNGTANGSTNGGVENYMDTSIEDAQPENGSLLDKSLDEFNELDLSESIDHVQEDIWLCESPVTSVTSPKSPYVWLKEDVNTPDLRRARPSLITKLDYIGIQNRDEQLEKIMNQHGYLGERQGRLYHSASFTSVMSLDWDYENEEARNNRIAGMPRHAWSDPRRKISSEFEPTFGGRPPPRRGSGERGPLDSDDPYIRQTRKVSYELEDPFSYHGRKFSFELEDPYDRQEDLDPLSLDVESAPVMRHSIVAPNPAILKRPVPQSSPARSRSPEKFSDFADDDLIAKPRGKVRPRKSRYTFERSDSKDSDSNSVIHAAPQSDQSDLDSVGEQASPRASRSSSHGSLLSDDMGPVRPRGAKDSSGTATGQVKKRATKTAKPFNQPQIKPRGAPTDKGDPSLKVKLPQNSSGGPVIRRRGAGTALPNGSAARPTSPLGADSSSQESLTMSPAPRAATSTPKTRQSLPQPRRSGIGTGIPTARGGIPRARRSASPDVPARRSGSPDARPRPRRGPGMLAQETSPLVTQSWQAGMH